MKIIIERGTAIAEILVSDRETPNGYKHVSVRTQANTAANAADLARDATAMLQQGRETWWRTRLEAKQEGEVGFAFVRFSFAMRHGPEHEYNDEWRNEHAGVLGFAPK